VIVLDASVAVDLLLDTAPHSDAIAENVRAHDGELHAPHLLDAEVAKVFRRFMLHRDLTEARAHRALDRLADLRLPATHTCPSSIERWSSGRT
jgi:predicted nucleic acid-binding protein